VLYAKRQKLWAHEPLGADLLIALLGVAVLAALYDLRAAGRRRWNAADVGCLALAAAPAIFLIVSCVLDGANAPVAGWLRNADWGLLGLSPATMLVGLTLVRHRLLPWGNGLPVLIGFAALPLDEVLKASTGARWLGLASAMTLGVAWIFLGVMSSRVPLQPEL
jgi:hypothetical protein